MKATREMAAKFADAYRASRDPLEIGRYVAAMDAALADVPEPASYYVPVARWHEATARIAELESKLEAVRKWADAVAPVKELDYILDGE